MVAYAMKRVTEMSFAEAESRIRDALEQQGFGILTEIDVQATLKKKIDVDRSPYKILGACNPRLANQGLDAEPDLGVLLPCNVCIYEADGKTVVAAMKPTAAIGALIDNDVLDPVARDAETRIWSALEVAIPETVAVEGAADR